MRILVSGCAGFVGSHLADRLIEEGHAVVGVDNFLTGRRSNLDHFDGLPRFQFLEQDVTEKFSPDGRFDHVLHLASPASPLDYLNYPIESLEVGSSGTKNLLDLALAHGAGFLLASTSECYGDPLEHPQKETYWGHVNPVGARSVCDEAKRFAEALTMAYHRRHGLNTHIARIFNTYGPRMKLNDGRVVPTFIDQALHGRPLTVYGDGSQTRSFCYVSDLVEGLYRLMQCREALPVNLGNPAEITILEFARQIQRLTGTSAPIEFRPLPEDDPKQRQPDISKAKCLLGWEPTVQLEEGLRRTIEYFQRAG
ncbi:MAG: SDR family oxidoreductase [Acidobacteria bacterium]|nr:SDR family oxidoreductase [Acidobacteriota bacterium]